MEEDILTPYATRKDIIDYYERHPDLVDDDIKTLIKELKDSLGIVDTKRYENPNGYNYKVDKRDIVGDQFEPFSPIQNKE